MAKEVLLAADFTEDKLAELKEKHGEVYKITVEDKSLKYDPLMVPDEDDAELEGVACYIRKPLDRDMNYAMTMMPKFIDAGKVIIKNCWLGGDPRILEEMPLLNAAALQAVELIETRKAKLKKV